jgi:hypothetical protein
MIVGIIQAAEKLQSALTRIKARTDKLQSYNEEYCNLIDIKTDLERVELYIEDMKMESLMNKAIGIEVQNCQRCSYQFFPSPIHSKEYPWLIMEVKLPKTCPNPKCRSPYWMKPRQVKGSKGV